jgi:uncharacterized membrane protein
MPPDSADSYINPVAAMACIGTLSAARRPSTDMSQTPGTVVLQLLPSGLVVPPVPYLFVLAVAGGAVVGLVYSRRPPVTQRVVAAFAPWMVAGAALHALYQREAVPAVVAPLAGAPAVYVTTFTIAGGVWLALSLAGSEVPTRLAVAGAVAALIPSGLVLRTGVTAGTFSPVIPLAALLVAVLLAGLVYAAMARVRPTPVDRAGLLGVLVVFGHTLDGVSTAVGVDLLGTGERSPLPRAIMDLARELPTAPLIGEGWLFVLVKLGVAVVVLDLFGDFVEDDPLWGNTALGVVAAVGLGPGAHNLLLFAAVGPV